MQASLLHIALSLLAGALAIAGLNLAFPAEVARAVTGVQCAALLANLPGAAGAARGVPVLTICRIQCEIVRVAARCVAGRGVAAVLVVLTTFRSSSRWHRA